MFGWFKLKPPLDPWEKAWTEDRLCRMATDFDFRVLLESPTLVPQLAEIPEVKQEADVERLLTFVKQWMRLDVVTHVQWFSDSDILPGVDAAPQDPKSVAIRVQVQHLQDRDTLVAVLARQLAQHALADTALGQEAWAGDLFPVFSGLGIFATNSQVRTTGQSDGLSWWTSLQRGYLPARIFGYALALREYARNNLQGVDWDHGLRPDAVATFRAGLHYLAKTGDSVFSRELLTRPRHGLSEATLWEELSTGSPSAKIAALWSLGRCDSSSMSRDGAPVVDCLREKHADVRAVAATVLPRFVSSFHAPSETMRELLDTLKDRSDRVRIATAATLRHFVGSELEAMIVEELTETLQDDVPLVVLNAATSLIAFGPAAQPALPSLLKRLRRALNQCKELECHTLLAAVNAISSDTTTCLTEFFEETDPEYLAQSLEMLTQLQQTNG